MHNCVTSHLWLKSALHASSHPCMCTCVLRCGCFLFTRLRPLLRSTALLPALPDVHLRVQREVQVQPLCDFRLGTVATSDHETPPTQRHLDDTQEQDQHQALMRVTKEKTPTADHQHTSQFLLLLQADSRPSQYGNLGKRPRIRRMARAEVEQPQLRPGARKTNGPHGEARSTRTRDGTGRESQHGSARDAERAEHARGFGTRHTTSS